MEILSPVGGQEQLIAAVRSGANAVYLGLKDFNARRNANNFDDLEQTVKYCHARNVKVYITLNTLIKDKEINKAIEAIKKVADAGADAIIVQDLAMYRLAKDIAPSLPIHASTQMTIHNIDGVHMLEKLGFSRVVPARELSLNELTEIRKSTDIEMEVFVHGALCMCMSGQCYLSSVLGQRSANRGLCAQPCRLDFKTDERSHALSLKDLSIIDNLKLLESIGIDSAKIEGRMKRPEYVSAATNACKNALCDEPVDFDSLKAVFSRSGFTDGYFKSKINADMFGYRTKEDVVSAAPILKTIANTYRNENPLVDVNMYIEIKSNKKTLLTVTCDDIKITVNGDIPEKAINKELDEQIVKRCLEKCGGTPYYLNNFTFDIEGGLSLAISSLNNLRKSALEKLAQIKSTQNKYQTNEFSINISEYNSSDKLTRKPIYARYENQNQIIANTDKIILDFEKIEKDIGLCEKYKGKLIAELPTLMFNNKDAEKKLARLKDAGITEIYATNLYAFELAKKFGFKTIGSFSLNILNSISLDEYRKLGLNETEITFETSLDSFNNLKKSIPCGLIVYGKMPLMTFRNCPIKSKTGCGSCECKGTLLDRYNNPFTVLCKDRKYSRLLNPQPIYMGDKQNLLKNTDYLSVYFTDESAEECLKIINKIKNGSEYDAPFTRGLYFKEIY